MLKFIGPGTAEKPPDGFQPGETFFLCARNQKENEKNYGAGTYYSLWKGHIVSYCWLEIFLKNYRFFMVCTVIAAMIRKPRFNCRPLCM